MPMAMNRKPSTSGIKSPVEVTRESLAVSQL